MARVPVDAAIVAQCRRVADSIAKDVQGFIDAHTTVGVERTVARSLGVTGADGEGTPLVVTAAWTPHRIAVARLRSSIHGTTTSEERVAA